MRGGRLVLWALAAVTISCSCWAVLWTLKINDPGDPSYWDEALILASISGLVSFVITPLPIIGALATQRAIRPMPAGIYVALFLILSLPTLAFQSVVAPASCLLPLVAGWTQRAPDSIVRGCLAFLSVAIYCAIALTAYTLTGRRGGGATPSSRRL